MQVLQLAQISQASETASAPIFGAESEKDTLNKLIEANGEHATVPGAPANATFSNNPIMTTMEMKTGPDALIGNAFENNAGDIVYLSGFKKPAEQNTELLSPFGGNAIPVDKSEGISFGETKVVELPKLAVPEEQDELSTSAASASSNPMEDMLKFLVALLASIFGDSANNSGTNDSGTHDRGDRQSRGEY